jgi:NADH-quinone oxidoreductase subunit A
MHSTPIDYLPIVLQFLVAFGFVLITLLFARWAGPRYHSKEKNKNFECGIESVGNARMPFSVKYFLVAILFVLFDVEVIFLYPWAVNFRTLGADAFLKMLVFMGLLLLGFVYVIKKKGLEWD